MTKLAWSEALKLRVSDGIILEHYDSSAGLSDNIVLHRNRFDHTGHCGIDILGSNVTVDENVSLPLIIRTL